MKYCLLILLGFCLHKGLEEVYDYSWQKGFKVCGEQYMKDVEDPKIDAPLSKRFRCAEKDMGLVYNLKYILLRPHWFETSFQERWYY